MAGFRAWLERLLLWCVWERMLEIEFVDRSIALAGKAFVCFFPLVIVVAALFPQDTAVRSSPRSPPGSASEEKPCTLVREAFASADDVRVATGLLGLQFTIFFASSFITAFASGSTCAAWRRPPSSGVASDGRGAVCLLVVLASTALLGGLFNTLGGGLGVVPFAVVALAMTSAVWWFVAWYLLSADVRLRVLVPTGVITGLATALYAASATIWMPDVVTENEAQFGVFGIALALVTWFSGAAMLCHRRGMRLGPCSPRMLDGSVPSSEEASHRYSPTGRPHRSPHPPVS